MGGMGAEGRGPGGPCRWAGGWNRLVKASCGPDWATALVADDNGTHGCYRDLLNLDPSTPALHHDLLQQNSDISSDQ